MKLLQRLDEKLIQKGSPRSTRETYGHWVEKYFRHILNVHGRDVRPESMGTKDVEQDYIEGMQSGTFQEHTRMCKACQ